MMEPKNLDKMNELQGYACLGVSVTVQLKGYDFFFRHERQDFVLDPGFTPFFWKRKGDDTGNDGPSQDNEGYDAPTRDASSAPASMDVNKLQGGNSNSIGKAVSLFPSAGSGEPMVFVVTPLNPNPTMPRAKEIVEKIHSRSPGLIAAASGASDQVLHASPSSGTDFFSGCSPLSPGPGLHHPTAGLSSPPRGADFSPGRTPASP
jgi:hypothetical protein